MKKALKKILSLNAETKSQLLHLNKKPLNTSDRSRVQLMLKACQAIEVSVNWILKNHQGGKNAKKNSRPAQQRSMALPYRQALPQMPAGRTTIYLF